MYFQMEAAFRSGVLLPLLLAGTFSFAAGKDVAVPNTCTPAVNAKLQHMIEGQPRGYVENVMVCGTAIKTVVNRGGRHGSHHIITLSAPMSDGKNATVQVAINDDLDGEVNASRGAKVFAYGQGYVSHGQAIAGVHDVHCSTHRAADNGWVVVDGRKAPASCPGR
jgi:hypothetical protein